MFGHDNYENPFSILEIMKNPLAVQIESWFGSLLVLVFAGFMIGFFLISVKNFNSDVDILNSTGTKLIVVSLEERQLIDQWLLDSNQGVSAKEVGYRYIISHFPDKPWATK